MILHIQIITVQRVIKTNHDPCIGKDEAGFTVKDAAAERKYGFSLVESLRKAKSSPLLASHMFYITPHVLPAPDEFAVVIAAAGGSVRPYLCL